MCTLEGCKVLCIVDDCQVVNMAHSSTAPPSLFVLSYPQVVLGLLKSPTTRFALSLRWIVCGHLKVVAGGLYKGYFEVYSIHLDDFYASSGKVCTGSALLLMADLPCAYIALP